MTTPLVIERQLSLPTHTREKRLVNSTNANCVPRIARLMALAIRMENLIRAGGITDYKELAQLGHVSRARITQIMNLLLLAPDIQEAILFLSAANRGREQIRLAKLQPIAQIPDWTRQRALWNAMIQNRSSP
jgi:hypothetical protein